MRNKLGQVPMHNVFVLILITATNLLAGCDFLVKISSSPEERINSAIPTSEIVISTQRALREIMKDTPSELGEMEREFNSRMKVRALNCGKGFSPSWSTSDAEIRAKLKNTSCFADADTGIARWLNLRRIVHILGQPPLRPIPSPAPAVIPGIEFIQETHFANSAGVALLSTPRDLTVVEIQSGNILFREMKGTSQSGALSANGRLFVSGESDRIRVRDSETGQPLAEFGPTRAHQFQWLNNHLAIFARTDVHKTALVDFLTGQEKLLDALHGTVLRAMPVPGKPRQFVLLMHQSLAKIELSEPGSGADVTLLEEIPFKAYHATNTSGLTSDAKRYFSVFSGLNLVLLKTMEPESLSLEPFRLQTAEATSNPDKILITGFIQSLANSRGHYVLSFGQRTLEKVDVIRLPSDRFVYIRPLNKLGVIAHSRIVILDEIPTHEPVTFDNFTEAALDEMVRGRAAVSEPRSAGMRASPAMPYAGGTRSTGPVDPGIGPVPGPVSELAKRSRIEAIGVYQAKASPAGKKTGERIPGEIEVRVKPSNVPLILSLSSYEPIQWKLVPEPGARISAVLLSGYHPSRVTGAGSARTVMIGRMYAYKPGTPEYANLDREIYRWTGKRIDGFQGLYEASRFSVGD
jgi:hypothetical protein